MTARGADAASNNSQGGDGATVSSTFALQAGDKLTIIVGEAGRTISGTNYGTGGGGGDGYGYSSGGGNGGFDNASSATGGYSYISPLVVLPWLRLVGAVAMTRMESAGYFFEISNGLPTFFRLSPRF